MDALTVKEPEVAYRPSWIDALLQWYRTHRRQLPWRDQPHPYPVMVSEFMLQQTRVEAMLGHYHRFLQRFPQLEDLAEADVEEVLALWSGLGYYRRARFLHAAAQAVVRAGGFPTSEEELRKLPGLGEYTAAAVLSIGLGRPALALDGNAIRVLSRLFGHPTPRRQEWREASVAHLQESEAGDFTQAVMELGATTCLPRNPRCLLCPLQEACQARRRGLVEQIPPAKPAGKSVDVTWCAAVLECGERRLLIKSHRQPFLRDNWLPPWGETLAELQTRIPPTILQEAGSCRHGITFRNLTVLVWRGKCESPEDVPRGFWEEHLWVERERLPQLAVSSLTRKILAVGN